MKRFSRHHCVHTLNLPHVLLQSSSFSCTHTLRKKQQPCGVLWKRMHLGSVFSDLMSTREFSSHHPHQGTAENNITFSDDLNIKFSFDYRDIYTMIREVNDRNIQFVFDTSRRQQLLDTLEIGMRILSSSNAEEKVSLTHQARFLPSNRDHEGLRIQEERSLINTTDEDEFEKQVSELRKKYLNEFCGDHYMPGRPEKPLLIEDMKQIPTSYKQAGVSLPIFLLHNMAHIELNAIDLCWHTLIMCLLNPIKESVLYSESNNDIHDHETHQLNLFEFMNDFIKIAKDEARHFKELSERLNVLGSSYGAVTSHKAIWNLARDTQYSLLERVVIGNCVLEGRGLDSGDRLISKMIGCGDMISCNIVRTICHEEEDHVRIGVKWFNNISQLLFKNMEGLTSVLPSQFDNFQKQLFQQIVLKYYGPLPGPFNHEARGAANMKLDWYEEISRNKIMKK